jgi:hypothetical protein
VCDSAARRRKHMGLRHAGVVIPAKAGTGPSSRNREVQARKGNAPGRKKPRRARDAARGEIRRRCAPTGRGIKPLKRGRCGSNAYAPKAPSTTDPRRDKS